MVVAVVGYGPGRARPMGPLQHFAEVCDLPLIVKKKPQPSAKREIQGGGASYTDDHLCVGGVGFFLETTTFSSQSATILVTILLLYVIFFDLNRFVIVFVCFPGCLFLFLCML